MSIEEVFECVKKLLKDDNLDVDLQSACKDTLDSLTFISLVVECEDFFQITVSDEDLFIAQYESFYDFSKMITKYLQ